MTFLNAKTKTSIFAASAFALFSAAAFMPYSANAACVAGKNTDPNSTVSCAGAANAVKDGTNITATGETAAVSNEPLDAKKKDPIASDENGTVFEKIADSIGNDEGAGKDPADSTSPAGKTDEADTGVVK